MLKLVGIKSDPGKEFVKLSDPSLGVPVAGKLWEMAMNLVKVHPIASIVGTWFAEADFTTLKDFSHFFGDLANLVVLLVGSDVEDFVVDRFGRSFERTGDRLGDIETVNERTPGTPIAGHCNLIGGCCQSTQIVENEVKALSWRCSECSGVSEIADREILRSERFQVAFASSFAFGVDSLRIYCCALVNHVFRRNPIDGAGRHVDETADTGLDGGVGEVNRALVVDIVGDVRLKLTEWIVGKLRHVNDRIEALEIFAGDIPNVANESRGDVCSRMIETALTIETGIESRDLVSFLEKQRSDEGTKVSFGSGDENFHAIVVTVAVRTSGSLPPISLPISSEAVAPGEGALQM